MHGVTARVARDQAGRRVKGLGLVQVRVKVGVGPASVNMQVGAWPCPSAPPIMVWVRVTSSGSVSVRVRTCIDMQVGAWQCMLSETMRSSLYLLPVTVCTHVPGPNKCKVHRGQPRSVVVGRGLRKGRSVGRSIEAMIGMG